MLSNAGNIFLGMPTYGKQTTGAGRGLWLASRNMDAVFVQQSSGSLLAANFNGLWCSALNLALDGTPVKYFAMLHDDVAPEDFWLDKLIEELEAKQLDVLSVVVPIKDTKGLTSTAIDSEDSWQPKCRLTMAEVHSLPETFTGQDIGGDLLVNTGCWVCRFDAEWQKMAYFTISDRIVQNPETKRYEAQVEPEDWNFSRQCNRRGLRIGATRKISVAHRGEGDFSNQRVWGQKFDAAAVSESQLPKVTNDPSRVDQQI
jgi:hypothetical protein